MEEYLLRLRAAEPVDTVKCRLCGYRDKVYGIFVCEKYGKCTTRPYTSNQQEAVCVKCEDFDSCREPITFAWPYVASASDELRYSLRSVAKFARVPHRVVVVGDIPPWYCGEQIPKQRQASGDGYGVWIDTLSKLKSICEHPSTSDDFVYMHDDHYWLKPFALPELRRERYNGPYMFSKMPITSKLWIGMQWRSAEFAKELGYTVDANWSSHTPFFLNKHRVLEVMAEMEKFNQPYLFEVPYFAKHSSFAKGHYTLEDAARLIELHDVDEIKRQCAGKVVMNHISAGYTDAVRAFLSEMLSEPSPWEQSVSTLPIIQKQKRTSLASAITGRQVAELKRLAALCSRSIEIGCGRLSGVFEPRSQHLCVDVSRELTQFNERSKLVNARKGVIHGLPSGRFDLIVLHSNVEGLDVRKMIGQVSEIVTDGGYVVIFPDRVAVADSELIARMSMANFTLRSNIDSMLLFADKRQPDAAAVKSVVSDSEVRLFQSTCVIPCVGYAKYLKRTLPAAIDTFSKVMIATSITDADTIRYAESMVGIENIVATEEWFGHGAVFNRGVGIARTLRFVPPGWITIMDADTLLPPNVSDIIVATVHDKRAAYSPVLRIRRHEIEGAVSDHRLWPKLPRVKATHFGYMMVFHSEYFEGKPHPWYPTNHLVCGDDEVFRGMFSKRVVLPFDVLDVNDNALGSRWKKVRSQWLASGKSLVKRDE